MVGATLAVALKETPLKIALIDATPLSQGSDHRLIALTHNSCDLFAQLSLWPLLVDDAAMIKAIQVTQKGHFGMAQLHASDIQQASLGHVVPAQQITQALETQLSHNPQITRVQPAKVIALSQNESEATLTLDCKHETKTLTAKIVVAADGTHSTIRHLLNIPVDHDSGDKKALVTITHLKRHHNHIAYERFHQTGALAMLPLTGNRAATIWTDQSNTIEQLLNEPEPIFLQTLQKQMGYRLGKFLQCEARFSYPLTWLQVKPEHQLSGRVILIGNAAHTLHPIAAQGLNLALQEVAALSRHFSKTLSLPNSFDYFSQQKTSIELSKQLTQIFSVDFMPVTICRNTALFLLDISPRLRRAFLQKALH